MSIRFGLAQMACGHDAQENIQTLLRFAQQAKKAGCTAVCFPEACITGYAPEDTPQRALAAGSPLLARLGDQAKALGVDLLAGFMERDGDAFYLTHSLFRADGARFDYRKTHLGENEGRVFAAGDRLRVFPLSCGLLCGLELCVETHFPEITQTLSLMGAQIVFAPHAAPGAPQKRRALWQTYIPARAYDNRVYVACCNHADGGRFGGGCCAADPRGGVVAECYAPQPALTVFDADPALIDSFRSGSGDIRLRYYPARRRPELYTLP